MESNQILKAAVVATLVCVPACAVATGFESLPTSGGASAYIVCNPTGDYGQGISVPPSATANNTCAVFADPTSDGYLQKSSSTRSLVMNNTYTGFSNVTVGTVNDAVFYKSSTKTYIYRTRVNLNSTQYANLYNDDNGAWEDAYFDINDIQRSGLTNIVGNVQVGYSYASATEVLFRVGRTSTAVVAVAGSSLPTLAAAPYDASTVDFTTDVSNEDWDGTSYKDSSDLHVKFDDAAGNTSGTRFNTGSSVIKFKQMGQNGEPLITIETTGFKPSF